MTSASALPACVASVALLAAALPKLLTYDSGTDEDAERRRQARASGLPASGESSPSGA